MAMQLKTPPASEPVTLAEVKDYLRILDANDDALLTGMITAARQAAEEFARRVFVTQTWTVWFDQAELLERTAWNKTLPTPGRETLSEKRVLEIPRPPLQSINLINTYDAANVGTLFPASAYRMESASAPGRLTLNENAHWPTNLRETQAVEAECVLGYGAASAVPQSIRQALLIWIKLLVANKSRLYEEENARGLVELNTTFIPPLVENLLRPYRLKHL